MNDREIAKAILELVEIDREIFQLKKRRESLEKKLKKEAKENVFHERA